MTGCRASGRGSGDRTLPPELINRIDDIILFQPLPPDVIRQIAELELTRVTDELAERGWRLTVDPDVVERLATEDYDPTYGARHLRRNIERHVLEVDPVAADAGLGGEGEVVVHVRADLDGRRRRERLATRGVSIWVAIGISMNCVSGRGIIACRQNRLRVSLIVRFSSFWDSPPVLYRQLS